MCNNITYLTCTTEADALRTKFNATVAVYIVIKIRGVLREKTYGPAWLC